MIFSVNWLVDFYSMREGVIIEIISDIKDEFEG